MAWLRTLKPDSLTEDPKTLNPKDHQPETYYANFEIVHVPSFRDDPQVRAPRKCLFFTFN